ncbi:MAG: hypothetical protein QOJ64_293 [Acidobacteriota bacterium]|jgi:hypothetical protein|nr:hypothetical protein [Acidobacteriota bacterium]
MQEQQTTGRCERCDRETDRLIKFLAPDNSLELVCWSCLAREEKHFNLKPTWKRGGRVR